MQLDEVPYILILQDIVRRSPGLTHVTVSGAHTCTKMRIDGFGGFAAFVTADVIRWISTDTWLEAQFSDLGIEVTLASKGRGQSWDGYL